MIQADVADTYLAGQDGDGGGRVDGGAPGGALPNRAGTAAKVVLPAIAVLTDEPFGRVFLDDSRPDGGSPAFLRAAGISVPAPMLTGRQDGRVTNPLARAGAAGCTDRSGLSSARLPQAPRRTIPAMRGTFNAYAG